MTDTAEILLDDEDEEEVTQWYAESELNVTTTMMTQSIRGPIVTTNVVPSPTASPSCSVPSFSRDRPKALLPFQSLKAMMRVLPMKKPLTAISMPSTMTTTNYPPPTNFPPTIRIPKKVAKKSTTQRAPPRLLPPPPPPPPPPPIIEIEACPICGEHFAQPDVAAHVTVHPQCGYCGDRFSSLKSIKDHIVNSHGSVNSADGGYHIVEEVEGEEEWVDEEGETVGEEEEGEEEVQWEGEEAAEESMEEGNEDYVETLEEEEEDDDEGDEPWRTVEIETLNDNVVEGPRQRDVTTIVEIEEDEETVIDDDDDDDEIEEMIVDEPPTTGTKKRKGHGRDRDLTITLTDGFPQAAAQVVIRDDRQATTTTHSKVHAVPAVVPRNPSHGPVTTPATDVPPLKRPVGRPSHGPVTTPATDVPPLKRPVGRPSHGPVTTPATDVPPLKRPVGRPRKSVVKGAPKVVTATPAPAPAAAVNNSPKLADDFIRMVTADMPEEAAENIAKAAAVAPASGSPKKASAIAVPAMAAPAPGPSKKAAAAVNDSAAVVASSSALRACRSRLGRKFWCKGCVVKQKCVYRNVKVAMDDATMECVVKTPKVSVILDDGGADDEDDDDDDDGGGDGGGDDDEGENQRYEILTDDHNEISPIAVVPPKPAQKQSVKMKKNPTATASASATATASASATATASATSTPSSNLPSPSSKPPPKKKYKAARSSSSSQGPLPVAHSSETTSPTADATTGPSATPLSSKAPKTQSSSSSSSVKNERVIGGGGAKKRHPHLEKIIKREVEETEVICLSDDDDDDDVEDVKKPIANKRQRVAEKPTAKKTSGHNQNSMLLQMIQQVVSQQKVNMTVMQNLISKQNDAQQMENMLEQAQRTFQPPPPFASLPPAAPNDPSDSLGGNAYQYYDSQEAADALSYPTETFQEADEPLYPTETYQDPDDSTYPTETYQDPADADPGFEQQQREEQQRQQQQQQPSPPPPNRDTSDSYPKDNSTNSDERTEAENPPLDNAVDDGPRRENNSATKPEASPKLDAKPSATAAAPRVDTIDSGAKVVDKLTGARLQLVLADGKIVDVEPHQTVPLKIVGTGREITSPVVGLTATPTSKKEPKTDAKMGTDDHRSTKKEKEEKREKEEDEKFSTDSKEGKRKEEDKSSTDSKSAEPIIESDNAIVDEESKKEATTDGDDREKAKKDEKKTKKGKDGGGGGGGETVGSHEPKSAPLIPSEDKKSQEPQKACRLGKKGRKMWCQGCRDGKKCNMLTIVGPHELKSAPLIPSDDKNSRETQKSCRMRLGKNLKKKWCRGCRIRKRCRLLAVVINQTVERSDERSTSTKSDERSTSTKSDERSTSTKSDEPSTSTKLDERSTSTKSNERSTSTRSKSSLEPSEEGSTATKSKSDELPTSTRSKSSTEPVEERSTSTRSKSSRSSLAVDRNESVGATKSSSSAHSDVGSISTKKSSKTQMVVGNSSKSKSSRVPAHVDAVSTETAKTSKTTKTGAGDDDSASAATATSKSSSSFKTCMTKIPTNYKAWCSQCKKNKPGCAGPTFSNKCKHKVPTQYLLWCWHCKRGRQGNCTGPSPANSELCQKNHDSFKSWCWYCKDRANKLETKSPDRKDRAKKLEINPDVPGQKKRCSSFKLYKFWCYQCKLKMKTCFYADGPRERQPEKRKTDADGDAASKKTRKTPASTDETTRKVEKEIAKPVETPERRTKVTAKTGSRKVESEKSEKNFSEFIDEVISKIPANTKKIPKEAFAAEKKSIGQSKEKADQLKQPTARKKSNATGQDNDNRQNKKRMTTTTTKRTAKKSTGAKRRKLDEPFFGMTDETANEIMMGGNSFAIDTFVMKFDKKGYNNKTSLEWNLNCNECKGPMDNRSHFVQTRKKCGRCDFATHCRANFDKHTVVFHREPLNLEKMKREEPLAPQGTRLDCAFCGFSTSFSDRMSVHMVKEKHRHCECMIAGGGGGSRRRVKTEPAEPDMSCQSDEEEGSDPNDVDNEDDFPDSQDYPDSDAFSKLFHSQIIKTQSLAKGEFF